MSVENQGKLIKYAAGNIAGYNTEKRKGEVDHLPEVCSHNDESINP